MDDFFAFAWERIIPALDAGLWTSILLIVPASLFGVAIGVSVGALRVYGPRPVVKTLDAYVSLFRGTPLVVQLYFWYFALPYVRIGDFALVLSPMWAAIVGFALCSGAYQSEYVRGALLSIKSGQYHGAQALGFTGWQTIRWIIVPQAFRRSLHGCGNEIVYLIKYSSLAYVVTCMELTGEGKTIAAEYFRFTEVFAVIGLYYLALVTVAILLLKRLEQRLAIPGFGQQ